jgi:hypothetical protein
LTPEAGTIVFRCGLPVAAATHGVEPEYEIPYIAMLPLLHGRVPSQVSTSSRSERSIAPNMFGQPSVSPTPRVGTSATA